MISYYHKLSKDDFSKKIREQQSLALFEFTVDWLGGSYIIDPIIKKLARDYRRYLDFYQINLESDSELIRTYQLNKFPTILFVKRGKIVNKIEGITSSEKLIEDIEKLIENDPIN
ncbi:MAG: thioredoxin family protein [Cytophagales bacterium]|nr:thioredoxin family protein [Cytophagales bacterium]